MISRWVFAGVILVAFKFIVDKTRKVRTAFASVKDYPGRTISWIKPLGPIAHSLGTTFPRSGMTGHRAAKFSLHKKFGATSFVSIFISTGQQYLWTAEPEAIKLILSDQHTFRKHSFLQRVMNTYKHSLGTTEGAEWKRHRSVAMSAFNEANVALVWSEAFRVVDGWFEQLDADGPDIIVNMLPFMTKASFLVIAAAGFGKRMPWSTDLMEEVSPGCQLTFRSALLGSVANLFFTFLIPGWFYQLSSFVTVPYLSSRALFARLAFDDLRTYMLDLVATARADIVSGEHSRTSRAALLQNLVEANMKQEGDAKRLTEEDVLSDVFLFLMAGHETTAHSLTFGFGLLALYPAIQQKIYEEASRIWPADVSVAEKVAQSMTNNKVYMDKLKYTGAFVRETLRMCPVANRLHRVVHADTALPSTCFSPGSKENPSVETGKLSITAPAGSVVVVDMWALHMNPLCWGEDVDECRPERFIDTESYQWPRDAFLPFSGGSRSCIGQRFALAEMIGVVASVVHRYRIQVPDDLAKKPFEEQKATLLECKSGLTLTPVNVKVKLCRRE